MNSTIPSVHLRAMEPEDLDQLYNMENDAECWDIGMTNVPYSRYVLHDYIASSTGDIYTDKQVRLMVENAEGKVVGIADLTCFDPRHLRAELGLVIQRSCRRQGYAKAAVAKICQYAKEVLHLHQIYVIIGEDNEASRALFRSTGFSAVSQLPDWLYDGTSYHTALLLQLVL